tara:strand:+ start:2364 stop:2771 length:408 start_codon:yes stop_codon:yes gene_type:complete
MIMKVAIVGSRQYTNKRKVQEFIWKLKEKFGESLEVVSGGQKDGADGYVKKYALEFEVKYSEFPPSHYSHNIHCILPKFRYNKPFYKNNYHKRNEQIAEYCDKMVAFLPKNLVTNGTASALNEAQKLGKKFVIIN